MIAPATATGLLDRFETIEHEETGEGVHEKYLALADALEPEALAVSAAWRLVSARLLTQLLDLTQYCADCSPHLYLRWRR